MTMSADAAASGMDAVEMPSASALATLAEPSRKADDDVDPAVPEVQRLRTALVAIADDRDPLARERGGIDVGVALGVHGISLLRLG